MAHSLDTKVAAIALNYFDTKNHVLECLKKTSLQTGENFENVTNTIFFKIPLFVSKIYVYAEDDSKMDKNFFGLLRKQNNPNLILAAMRIFARNQTNMDVLLKIYRLYFEMFGSKDTASYDAWRIIEIGIAERHIMYDKDVIYDEKSPVISTFERNTRYFIDKGNVNIFDFAPPPAISGYSFMRTILTTHFGLLICRDLFSFSILETYAKDKRIKKILNTRKNTDTIKQLAILSSAATGMYAKNPLQMYKNNLQRYESLFFGESLESMMLSYNDYNIYLL